MITRASLITHTVAVRHLAQGVQSIAMHMYMEIRHVTCTLYYALRRLTRTRHTPIRDAHALKSSCAPCSLQSAVCDLQSVPFQSRLAPHASAVCTGACPDPDPDASPAFPLPFCGRLRPHTTRAFFPATSTPPCNDSASAARSACARVTKFINAQSVVC